MVGVIVPGMAVYGTPSTLQISPFGTFGGTGTGGVGTYALTGNPGTFTFVGDTGGVASTTLTVTSAPSTNNQIAVGDTITGTGISANTIITAYQSGTGGTGTYTLNQTATVAASTTITNSGTLFTSGSPGTIYAWQAFYDSATATASQSSDDWRDYCANAGDCRQQDLVSWSVQRVSPPLFSGWGGSLANVGMFYGQFPSSGATPSTTALASLCKKSTDFQSFATANGITVNSLYRLNDPGIWAQFGASRNSPARSPARR